MFRSNSFRNSLFVVSEIDTKEENTEIRKLQSTAVHSLGEIWKFLDVMSRKVCRLRLLTIPAWGYSSYSELLQKS